MCYTTFCVAFNPSWLIVTSCFYRLSCCTLFFCFIILSFPLPKKKKKSLGKESEIKHANNRYSPFLNWRVSYTYHCFHHLLNQMWVVTFKLSTNPHLLPTLYLSIKSFSYYCNGCPKIDWNDVRAIRELPSSTLSIALIFIIIIIFFLLTLLVSAFYFICFGCLNFVGNLSQN